MSGDAFVLVGLFGQVVAIPGELPSNASSSQAAAVTADDSLLSAAAIFFDTEPKEFASAQVKSIYPAAPMPAPGHLILADSKTLDVAFASDLLMDDVFI